MLDKDRTLNMAIGRQILDKLRVEEVLNKN